MTPDAYEFQTVVLAVASGVIAIGIIQNAIYLFQLALAYFVLQRRASLPGAIGAWWKLSDSTMPISLLVPAYNEETTIVENVRSLLSLHYPNFEVVVINDGSSDGTLKAVVEAFGLAPVQRYFKETVKHRPIRSLHGSARFPRLLVVDKENGGKSDALNAGINLSRKPVFCAVDADSLLEADALLRAIQPFTERPDRVVAVGGTIRLANGCAVRSGRVVDIGLPRSLLALLQVTEYLRAFLMARLAWSHVNALMLISGAFGIIRRDVAIDVGGYSHGTVGEDLEIIVKIHRFMREAKRDYEIIFIPDPVCWTEAPESMRMLARQRMRWQRGALETFFKHSVMLANPRYGKAGIVGFGQALISDVLAPPVEALGYVLMPLFWWMGLMSWDIFAAYLALTFSLGVFISVGSLILEELKLKRFPHAHHLAVLMIVAVLENFGYRQVNNLWRIAGWWQFLRGTGGWGEMHRKGFNTEKRR